MKETYECEIYHIFNAIQERQGKGNEHQILFDDYKLRPDLWFCNQDFAAFCE